MDVSLVGTFSFHDFMDEMKSFRGRCDCGEDYRCPTCELTSLPFGEYKYFLRHSCANQLALFLLQPTTSRWLQERKEIGAVAVPTGFPVSVLLRSYDSPIFYRFPRNMLDALNWADGSNIIYF